MLLEHQDTSSHLLRARITKPSNELCSPNQLAEIDEDMQLNRSDHRVRLPSREKSSAAAAPKPTSPRRDSGGGGKSAIRTSPTRDSGGGGKSAMRSPKKAQSPQRRGSLEAPLQQASPRTVMFAVPEASSSAPLHLRLEAQDREPRREAAQDGGASLDKMDKMNSRPPAVDEDCVDDPGLMSASTPPHPRQKSIPGMNSYWVPRSFPNCGRHMARIFRKRCPLPPSNPEGWTNPQCSPYVDCAPR